MATCILPANSNGVKMATLVIPLDLVSRIAMIQLRVSYGISILGNDFPLSSSLIAFLL